TDILPEIAPARAACRIGTCPVYFAPSRSNLRTNIWTTTQIQIPLAASAAAWRVARTACVTPACRSSAAKTDPRADCPPGFEAGRIGRPAKVVSASLNRRRKTMANLLRRLNPTRAFDGLWRNGDF